MKPYSFFPVAIIALNQNNRSKERLLLKMRGFFTFREVLGVYRGQSERAWVVPVTTKRELDQLLMLAKDYDQECILYSDVDRRTQLVYTEDSRREDIGVLAPVPEKVAVQRDGYTYDPETKVYWTTLG